MHKPPKFSAMTVLLALIAALTATVAVTAGPAGAQTEAFVNPGTMGAETENLFCVNIQAENLTGNLINVTATGLPAGLSVVPHDFGAVNPEERFAITGTPSAVGTSTVTLSGFDDVGTPGVPGDDVALPDIMFDINVSTTAAADIVVAAGRLGIGYTIDCESQGREVHNFLRSFDNFGPGGTVTDRIAIKNHTPFNGGLNTGEPLDAAYLDGVDILMDGWVFPSQWSPAELTLIEDWVDAGGVLIAAEDRPDADTLAERFGAPSLSSELCTHTPSETGDPGTPCPVFSAATGSTSPVVDGPFGNWSSGTLMTSGSVGHFGDPAGWETIAVNQGTGNSTIITKPVGQGRVFLVSDEGLFRTQSYPSNENQTFIGNLIDYAANDIHPVLVDDAYTGKVGESFSENLCTNDIAMGDLPTTVTSGSGSLPGGLTRSGCVVSGTPTAAGSFSYDYTVTDAEGDSDTATATFTIADEDGPVITAMCKGKLATIVGTSAGETILGTPGDDVIVGRGGNDTIRGRRGNDTICAGGGDDTIIGGVGADIVLGNAGNDTIRGLIGNDRLFGGRGRDILRGGPGTDRCNGGAGNADIATGCENVTKVP